MSQQPEKTRMSYADLLTMDDDQRYELHEGTLVAMSPSPSVRHQDIVGGLYAEFRDCLRGCEARAYVSPLDVRLFETDGMSPENVNTVVQPDVFVICDQSHLDERGLRGAPDLAVEVLSDSTRGHDQVVKFDLYRRAGVPQYWIVDPKRRTLLTFQLKDEQYYPEGVYGPQDRVPVNVCGADCEIDLSDVFGD